MKSACVSLIGRPSSGKSSLVNLLIGRPVSIVSAVPQTTRNRIRGIYTDGRGQLLFLDTPGYHLSDRKFNRLLQEVTRETLPEGDLALYVVDVSRPAGEEELAIRGMLAGLTKRLVVALNKIDLAPAAVAAARAGVEGAFPGVRIAAVSARSGQGREELVKLLFDLAPEGEPLYPPEFYTDQPPAFRIAEVVRERVIAHTAEEVPHAVYVEIADLEMNAAKDELWVRGFICVERESQKGIVIGKGGDKIRRIMEEAGTALRDLFPYRLTLDFRVRVRPRWRRDDGLLKKLIY